MSDPNFTTLCNEVGVYTITITDTATLLKNLVTMPTGRSASQILSVTLLGVVTAGTARSAVLYGGTDVLGYLTAGYDKTFPARGGMVYLKRAAAADVTAQVEIAWGK